MKNKRHQAFSLIEISVVIVVIGILIAGISNGIELYDDYKLKVAQTLTKNSRVNRIPDLEMWLETTGENSLAMGTTSFTDKPNPADQDRIGRWNDINPNIIATAKNKGIQSTFDSQPKYIRKGMNGLPTLLFDGADDYFSYNGDFLVGADYTIFVVEARNSSNNVNYFLAGISQLKNNETLHLGYRMDNIITQAHYGNDLDKSISNFKSTISRIHSFVFSKSNGKSIYTDGGVKTNNVTQKSPLTSYPGATIGYFENAASYYYKGSIAEIIFYTRALADKERQEVETYLSKKWGIKIG